MPNDLLLPAFLLTLIVNAILVAAAIRALSHSREERDGPLGRPDWPVDRPATPPTAGPEPGPREDPVPPGTGPTTSGTEPPEAPVSKPVRRRAATSPASPPPRPRRKRAAPDASADGVAPRDVPSAGRRGSRRKFSLPPLEDHDRVSRSIETFLSSGSDAVESGDAAVASPAAEPTTIAAVAIHGFDGRSASVDPSVKGSIDAAVATLEQALRSAARASDHVTVTGPTRLRIVLPATGELAARAYLRRVRATVEPSLAASHLPLELATATTTVLDEALEVAAARADARLDATISARAEQAAGDQPRAAGD